jgi:hypothetical protein
MMMQDPKKKKAIMADAYSDKRVNELKKATNTPYQMEMASKKLGSMKKKSFPDLNKDGKVTKADILKGRGVIK